MDIYVLDENLSQIACIDNYKSLIWTKRYYQCGDFELYLPANKGLLEILQIDRYIIRDDDTSVMVIEKIEIETDLENGDYIICSGRSLESLMARRIVGSQTIINETDVVQGLKSLVDEWTTGTGITVDDSLQCEHDLMTQITGAVLLDAVSDICRRFGLGFRMTIDDLGGFLLTFYEGSEVDVVFSPEFDNLLNSRYTYDISNYCNEAKIMGEGTGLNRLAVLIHRTPQATGNNRRSLYVDARDISRNDGSISQADYIPMLIERGWEKLAEHEVTETFEAEISPQMTFKYKTDYKLGDIVTVENGYGITAKPRIVEIIESWDESGYSCIPTFEALEV